MLGGLASICLCSFSWRACGFMRLPECCYGRLLGEKTPCTEGQNSIKSGLCALLGAQRPELRGIRARGCQLGGGAGWSLKGNPACQPFQLVVVGPVWVLDGLIHPLLDHVFSLLLDFNA